MKTKEFYCTRFKDYVPMYHTCDAGIDTHNNKNCIDMRTRDFAYVVKCFYCRRYDISKARVVEK